MHNLSGGKADRGKAELAGRAGGVRMLGGSGATPAHVAAALTTRGLPGGGLLGLPPPIGLICVAVFTPARRGRPGGRGARSTSASSSRDSLLLRSSRENLRSLQGVAEDHRGGRSGPSSLLASPPSERVPRDHDLLGISASFTYDGGRLYAIGGRALPAGRARADRRGGEGRQGRAGARAPLDRRLVALAAARGRPGQAPVRGLRNARARRGVVLRRVRPRRPPRVHARLARRGGQRRGRLPNGLRLHVPLRRGARAAARGGDRGGGARRRGRVSRAGDG